MKRIFTRISVLAAFCLLTINVALAQNITVKGKVIDGGDKTSLPGVTILIKGTQNGTQTDENGNYSISAPANATLVFNFVGYTALELAVNNQTTLNVSLASSTQQLEQVVVVGYGTQRKIDVTGSVASLKGEEISKQASTNAVSALQGKVAGVSITNNGAPGSSPQIRIRGLGTIFGNDKPLYVVDGVWYDDINFLNPGDIENLSVLKDASAQSIYGIRAANGVVLVTTKKGKLNSQATINYDGYVGFQKVTNQVEMANATEYGTIINELYTSNGSAPLFANPSSLGGGTNWYNQILRDAMVTNHQISIMGGSEKSTYNLSLGYLNQDGIVKNNNFKRYTARLSNDFQVFKPLKVGYNVTGVMNNSNDAPTSIFHQLFSASPTVPVFNADGSYGDPNSQKLGDGANFNPQATLDFFNQKTKNYQFTGNVYAELKFAKHFTFKTSFGGDFGQSETRTYAPAYYATFAQKRAVSQLDIKRIETRNWIVENTLTYQNTFNENHNLTFLVGQSAQRRKTYTLNAGAANVPYNSESDLYLALGDAATRSVLDAGALTTFASYFARANYSFKNKYLLNASIRADGASQFFGFDTWGYFPSVGAGWVVTQEDFMKDQHIFDNLKIRGSWGKVGNANVPSNPATQLVAQNAALIAIFNNTPATGASINTVVPPSIFWERGVGTNIGFEAAFLKNRLTVEADYYNRKTSRAIFFLPTFFNLGTVDNQVLGNQADIQNRGVDVSVNWSDKTDGGFAYSFGANLNYNQNKVLSVESGATPIYSGSIGVTNGYLATRTVVNEPIGQFYGYKVIGIFQNAADIAASPTQSGAAPSNFKYQDTNGDGVVDSRDKVTLGNPNPKFNYGFNTAFSYKNFDLALDFQGVAGVQVYNSNIAFRYGNENFTKDFYDNRWHGAGTSNTYPSANVGSAANSSPNSFYVENGSYFRVRNIQLGYTLPKTVLNKWKIQKIRFYANAQNALNIFGYKGFSPEVGPSAVDNAAKISSSLSNTTLNAGLDANVYPLYATYNFGVNVTF
ncbi:TonB-linked SusC/RagA family outer membrane protein [Pedobacter sp. AK013]|uniref:SusC/RagA family TonB-linked outer membrane protein n=1 Tax=Pedobacter sp. AK013 TaxID=2723071 RepID=UPI00161C2057|nr:TonB-dependent receptor [Pedobacter sp. AK013]MBB6236293.1 TonB-linked SusC/RagA family outer membrane protein [Pedobacter sp. AK013]